ncbi:MAG: 23S rRNA (pseudouridine(1915)-N(3))-methyltransferase RlmH [Bacteroidales bacterium]|nr:23S rRNA (pseudouridine(1915)-N(3))-methyltransferase RlmH [Bacteroidales bacterium]
MKITILLIGKTEKDYLKKELDLFENRLKHYIPVEVNIIPAIKSSKNLSIKMHKLAEAELILKQIKPDDHVILLDEKGKQYSSEEFASFIQGRLNTGIENLLFVIGGPFGFHEKIYEKANSVISLSKMTFSHQMIRLLFIEQLYRAFTILRNEKYHH